MARKTANDPRSALAYEMGPAVERWLANHEQRVGGSRVEAAYAFLVELERQAPTLAWPADPGTGAHTDGPFPREKIVAAAWFAASTWWRLKAHGGKAHGLKEVRVALEKVVGADNVPSDNIFRDRLKDLGAPVTERAGSVPAPSAGATTLAPTTQNRAPVLRRPVWTHGVAVLVGAALSAALASWVASTRGSPSDAHGPPAEALATKDLTGAFWRALGANGHVVPPGDPCLAYEGQWTMNESYALDPGSHDPLISKASDVQFFARCRVDEPGSPARLVGVDITRSAIFERGHTDLAERVAETTTLATVSIGFENGRPSTREMNNLQRVRTALGPKRVDEALVAQHIASLNQLSRAQCTTEGTANQQRLVFRCRSSAREFVYEKSLTRWVLASP